MGRLPFLRRNLRAGFKSRCQLIGTVSRHQALPRRSISVIYSCQSTDPTAQGEHSSFTTRTSITDWLCPLCNIHGAFANQRMLHMHLSWDHPSVEVQWRTDFGELVLTIPQSPPSPSDHRFPSREPSACPLSYDIPFDVPRIERIKVSQEPPDRISTTPSVTTTTSAFDTKEDIKAKLSPPRATSQLLSESSRRSSTASGRPSSQHYSPLHARSRFPQDVLGPSATYPFLPDRIGNDVYYSCRPGGPRLYDILNTQSLEPYGVLQWLIVDREEELFELDDVRDEDKVMLALWYRWIFLNRNKFVAHYFNGTKSFVKENWQMIRQGAGLLALRAWLLTLCINNFLYPSEVVTLLRFYQEMAGIR
ncbi:hypothetical protein F5I97DRAFT_355505 [Phlebopus sp. FC_14]|nr:hypothetical protein F5I97DRAFT_355505 [Phlebopus sp. FC_14]